MNRGQFNVNGDIKPFEKIIIIRQEKSNKHRNRKQ